MRKKMVEVNRAALYPDAQQHQAVNSHRQDRLPRGNFGRGMFSVRGAYSVGYARRTQGLYEFERKLEYRRSGRELVDTASALAKKLSLTVRRIGQLERFMSEDWDDLVYKLNEFDDNGVPKTMEELPTWIAIANAALEVAQPLLELLQDIAWWNTREMECREEEERQRKWEADAPQREARRLEDEADLAWLLQRIEMNDWSESSDIIGIAERLACPYYDDVGKKYSRRWIVMQAYGYENRLDYEDRAQRMLEQKYLDNYRLRRNLGLEPDPDELIEDYEAHFDRLASVRRKYRGK